MSFIDAHDFAVGLVLRVLGISSSTYYGWRARQAAPSRRRLEDAELLQMICKVRSANEFAAAYRSPRVWLELRRQGVRCGRKRIERIMRENGLAGAYPRKGRRAARPGRTPSTRQHPTWSNATSPRPHRTGCG
jgi:putative transposase